MKRRQEPQSRTLAEQALFTLEEHQEVLEPGDLRPQRGKIEVGKNG